MHLEQRECMLTISETAVSKGESALGVRYRIDLVPMMRDEAVVSKSLLHCSSTQNQI